MLIKIYDKNPSERAIQQVVDSLERGGVVVYPTDSVYAFGCSLSEPKAIESMRKIKGKVAEEFAVLFANLSQVAEYCRVDNDTFKLLKRNLPGPFVFILQASSRMPDKALSKRKSIGVRMAQNSVAKAIVERLGSPMLTTSVDALNGEFEYATTPELIDEKFGQDVALVVDGGVCSFEHTTIVDLTGGEEEILRYGKGELK
ncbi:MAG: L-threonylcarbamoyladenylate synthase [Alistipes sp.]|nr:L-threonylcarbamoyladenylate synthase [Alistipes sp.]